MSWPISVRKMGDFKVLPLFRRCSVEESSNIDVIRAVNISQNVFKMVDIEELKRNFSSQFTLEMSLQNEQFKKSVFVLYVVLGSKQPISHILQNIASQFSCTYAFIAISRPLIFAF